MEIFPFLCFVFAAYSVVANDVIQTLGTFLSSNKKVKSTVIYLFFGIILTLTLIYGWVEYEGDVSYKRLSRIPQPVPFYWWYISAPFILLIITRLGIPVSTTFLMLSLFSSQLIITKIVIKSLSGYIVSFGFSFLIYILISRRLENYFSKYPITQKWIILQWLTTGSLWSIWLIQDLANIYVFLPRQLSPLYLIVSLLVLLGFLGYIIRSRGGKIQRIVNSKINTADIRAASIIDGIYVIILYFFKELNDLPMSTTWVFVGLLAGRELGINFIQHVKPNKYVYKMLSKDFIKILLGLFISIATAYMFKILSLET